MKEEAHITMEDFNLETVYNLVFGKIEGWLETFIKMLPNFVMAAVVLVLFFLLSKGLRTLSGKLMKKVSSNVALNRLVSTVISVFVIGVGLFTALTVLQLDKAVTSLLAGAGILGLALSFAFQDSASNFISGVFLALRKPINIGDIVKSQDVMGKVKEMSLRNTLIESFQGQHIYIPNKEVYQNILTNYSQPGVRRVDIPVGVSYGDDMQLVRNKTVDAIKKLPFIIREDEVSFIFEEFGGSSINGILRFWIDYPGEKSFLNARSEAMRVIKQTFDENDIMIPFPIRTLDFGIKGGEKLSTMVNNEMSISNSK